MGILQLGSYNITIIYRVAPDIFSFNLYKLVFGPQKEQY